MSLVCTDRSVAPFAIPDTAPPVQRAPSLNTPFGVVRAKPQPEAASLFKEAAAEKPEEISAAAKFLNTAREKTLLAGAVGTALTIGEIGASAVVAIGGMFTSVFAGIVSPKAGELIFLGTAKFLGAMVTMLPYTAIAAAACVGSWLIVAKIADWVSGPKDG